MVKIEFHLPDFLYRFHSMVLIARVERFLSGTTCGVYICTTLTWPVILFLELFFALFRAFDLLKKYYFSSFFT